MNPLKALSSWLREIPVPEPRPTHTGVYFLISRGTVVYVGQSLDVERRMIAHWSSTRSRNRVVRRRFDRALFIPLAVEDLNAYEGALIRALRPKYNRVATTRGARDEEVLAVLGIPPNDVKCNPYWIRGVPKGIALGKAAQQRRRAAARKAAM